MKPPEILAMIEEAAGTRMYEAKKQQAEKTIEKKDAKLKEINDILAEEINPTLTKLKEERTTYLEYQKIQRELDHLTKLYVAYKFIKAEEMASKADLDLGQIIEKKAKLEEESRSGWSPTRLQYSVSLLQSRISVKRFFFLHTYKVRLLCCCQL